MIMVLARGISRPFSMIVVHTRMSNSWRMNRSMVFSSSASPIWPCPTPMRAPGASSCMKWARVQRLLSDQLGGELPAPAQLAPDVINRDDDLRSTLEQMQLWIQLLDMAITPAMLRVGVQSDLDPEVAEALLRYFARQRDSASATSGSRSDC